MSKLTIGTGVSALVVLLGLALALVDYRNSTVATLLVIVGVAVFVVCALVEIARLWRRLKPTVLAWVRNELDDRNLVTRDELHKELDDRNLVTRDELDAQLAQLPKPLEPGEAAPQGDHTRTAAQIDTTRLHFAPTEAAELRAAVNLISGELEDVAAKIREDDNAYWAKYYLPTYEWTTHGELLARHDDKAHQAARTAYREIERVKRCLEDQRQGDGMGDVWFPDDGTVQRCKPSVATDAIIRALSELRRVLDEAKSGVKP